jgi:hypothetical protein
MNVRAVTESAGIRLVIGLLDACGGGEGDGEGWSPPPLLQGTVIGPAGGTVLGPNGAKVALPPGALMVRAALRLPSD